MKKVIFSIAALAFVVSSCFDDDVNGDSTFTGDVVTRSIISGGTNNIIDFCASDETRIVDDITVVTEGSEELNMFIVRDLTELTTKERDFLERRGEAGQLELEDDQVGEILGLYTTTDEFPDFNDDEFPNFFPPMLVDKKIDTYGITQIHYQEGLQGIEIGDVLTDLSTDVLFSISSTVTVNVEDCREIAPAIFARENEEGILNDDYSFCVDGLEDRANDIQVTFDGIGETAQIVITDTAGNILGLPDAFNGPDFDEAGVGECYIRHINYNGEIGGLNGPDENGDPTSNIDDLVGEFELSDFIRVIREDCSPNIIATTLAAGPSAPESGEYTFSVSDGTANNVTDLVITFGSSEFEGYVVTDDTGVILGLPDDIAMVDFDTQGAGICYIRYINYDGEIQGLTGPGEDGEPTSNISDLEGEFKLSNFIVVNRIEGEE